MKTLINTILPRIALYKVLSKSGFTEDVVYKHMRKYMLDIVAAKKALIYGENGVDTGILRTLQQHNS